MPTTNPLGVQLYTLRDVPADERPVVFKALAGAGYGAVEPFNNRAESPQRLRAELDEAGLVVSSIHNRPADDFDGAVATARATSATQTGWNLTLPRSTGTTGAACIAAKRLRKSSSWPNITDGRRIAASGKAARTAASPSALLRP